MMGKMIPPTETPMAVRLKAIGLLTLTVQKALNIAKNKIGRKLTVLRNDCDAWHINYATPKLQSRNILGTKS